LHDQTRGRIRQHARDELAKVRDIRLVGLRAMASGVVIGVAASVVRLALNEATGSDTWYFLLLAATVLAAWYTGLVGGIAVAATTAIAATLALAVSETSLVTDRGELLRLALYAAVAAATVALVAGRRAATIRLQDATIEVADLAGKIEERDQRLELMLAASGTGFWEWDVATGELVWSDAIFEQHGLPPGTAPPSFGAYLDLIHPDDRATFQDGLRIALDDDIPFSLEFRVVRPDGSVHWLHGSGRAFRDATGRPIRMVGTGQDITERRRVEEERDRLLQEERHAAVYREAFVDVISHELRTPITTILGLTQILTKPGRTDDPTALLDDVRAESERLHRLVEDLLVLSRVERGRLGVDAEPLQLARMLERLVERESVVFPSIKIELRLEPRLPIVAGEETYIEQIVRNLLGNAAKYCPPGTPVTVQAERDDAGTVAVRVLDDGPGISEAAAARAFELFYRDPARSRAVAGSGIGLFVCAALVEAMGGRIWARRRPEGGSEFGFTLPLLEDDEATSIAPATDDLALV
jgi:PAS domain S-box-containing protein